MGDGAVQKTCEARDVIKGKKRSVSGELNGLTSTQECSKIGNGIRKVDRWAATK